AGTSRNNMPEGLPFHLFDYIELVEWTGRQIREGKHHHIRSTQHPMLERLGLNSDVWLNICTKIETGILIGTASSIQAVLPKLNRQDVPGQTRQQSYQNQSYKDRHVRFQGQTPEEKNNVINFMRF
ncbi:hypothetical protein CAG71_15845, partial [Photobacterium halotolerans]|nr:hypothetical protein [Photobacterium halotolerans]